MEQIQKPKKFEGPFRPPARPPHTSPKGPVQKKGLLLIGQPTLYPMHSTLNICMFFILGKRKFSCPT